jgi:hypothetical protein
MNLEFALKLCALVHLGLVAAGALMPRVTGLWAEMKRLSPFGRTLFRVYYAFIGLCLVSFGAGSWIFAHELAGGSSLARAICAFLAVFWTLRLVAAWLLDVRPYLINRWRRVGYGATNVVFTLLPLVYAWGALPRA